MANMINHFDGMLRVAKLLLTLPRPAPALASEAVTALKLVRRSLPNAINAKVKKTKRAAKTEMNPHIDCRICLDKVCPPNLILQMALGWRRWVISRLVPLKSSKKRITLIPPLVEAAQPPVIAKNIIRIGAKLGQMLKGAEVNPVVVDKEITLNRLFVSA